MTWRKPSMAARKVAREAGATRGEDDVEEAKHGRAAVLDLHHLVAEHVARRDEAKRVIHAKRPRDANVTLREHLDLARAHDRGREGLGRLDEGKSNSGFL